MPHLLGIDIGTSGTKTLICDENGKVLATNNVDHTLQAPKPLWYEQNPHEWWTASCKSVKGCLKKAGLKAGDIAAIGLSGQMHGSVFLDKNNNVLRPAILWNDQRTTRQCEEITEKAGGTRQLVEMVANPALPGFTAPKILWVRQHEPKLYAKARHILLPKDYIRHMMCGVYATDMVDASGTALLDVQNRRWSDELLKRLDIDRDLLPELYESPDVTGELTTDAAKAMGLKAGTPVVAGSGDAGAGAVGNGIVTGGLMNAVLGTSGVMCAHSDTPTLDLSGAKVGRVHTMCHAVPGKWIVFGCMLSAAGSFQWYAEHFAELERQEAKKSNGKKSVFELLLQKAEKAPAGCEGLFFLPYLTGERCPHPDPDARAGWIGATRRTDRPMLIRSLIEGITFGMNDMLKILRDDMKIPVSQIRSTGGGSKSAFWRQMQADIYNAPLAVTNSQEGGAYGVALLAGVGTGVWKSVEAACKATIKTSAVTKPNKKAAQLYSRYHDVYAKLYDDLKGRFEEIADLGAK